MEQEEKWMNVFICYEKCGTCKKAEKWMIARGIAYKKRSVREENPSSEELKAWQKISGLPIRRFFNTSGQLYKSMNLKEKLKEMSEEEQFKLLGTDGMLVKRPILLCDGAVLVGFQPEMWESVL